MGGTGGISGCFLPSGGLLRGDPAGLQFLLAIGGINTQGHKFCLVVSKELAFRF